MHAALAILVGVLSACGIFLLLRRNIVKFLFGLALISQAVNLAIFTAGGVVRFRPPLIEAGQKELLYGAADPLPQALILTAIVIGFGILVFSMVLILRTYQTGQQVDLDKIWRSER
jgi:multicomponent Na+:H+ antiporter subunit C